MMATYGGQFTLTYSVVARYWHDGGQWNDDAELNFGNGNFNVRSTGWGGYLVVGYNF
ncbi:outer membrane protein OmpK [Escherichia coli]|uniref:outer membrane protein OmpK n=1 Tax=Escherichia coli TaxID=562 RepID=UPI0035B3D835